MKNITLTPYDTFDLSTFVIHGNLVHIGHFGGMFDDDGEPLTTIEEQTVQTFHNLGRALREINLSLRNLLKVTVILKDISNFQGMHSAWKQVFSSNYPVRTTITSGLVDENCQIEIDGVAGIE